VNHHF
jgi:inner membrane protease ATP23